MQNRVYFPLFVSLFSMYLSMSTWFAWTRGHWKLDINTTSQLHAVWGLAISRLLQGQKHRTNKGTGEMAYIPLSRCNFTHCSNCQLPKLLHAPETAMTSQGCKEWLTKTRNACLRSTPWSMALTSTCTSFALASSFTHQHCILSLYWWTNIQTTVRPIYQTWAYWTFVYDLLCATL